VLTPSDPSLNAAGSSISAAVERPPERTRALVLSPTHLHISRQFIGVLAGALLMVALWFCLRVIYFNGFYLEDAPGYVTDAAYVALGQFRARDYVTGLNVGTFVPVALPLAVFGKTEAALSLWPLACSLLGMTSMAAAVARLCGARWGLFAALLYATYPGDVFFSTVVMPDAIQAGWVTFSIALVVAAFNGSFGDSSSRRSRLLLVAGVAMAVCQLVRGNGPILLPVGLAAIFLLQKDEGNQPARQVWRPMAVYLGGWLLIQALEGAIYLWSAGDFFHRAHVVSRHYGSMQSIGKWGLNTDLGTIPYSVFAPLLWMRTHEWGDLNAEQAYHGLIFLFAFAALALAVLASRRLPLGSSRRALGTLWLGTFWTAWPLLYHEFGSQSLTQFVPIHRLSRHLVVYAPGAIFLAVVSVAVVARSLDGRPVAWRRAAGLAAVAALVMHFYFNWQGISAASLAFHRTKATYVRIREHLPTGTRTMVGDPGDLCFFDFWLNPLGNVRVNLTPFASYARCDQLVSGVVITKANAGWDGMAAPVIRETVQRLPCLVDPPPSWRLLYDGFPERVFEVGGRSARATRSPNP
jgi:hypothetical protein